jgi:hypothetical protein
VIKGQNELEDLEAKKQKDLEDKLKGASNKELKDRLEKELGDYKKQMWDVVGHLSYVLAIRVKS